MSSVCPTSEKKPGPSFLSFRLMSSTNSAISSSMIDTTLRRSSTLRWRNQRRSLGPCSSTPPFPDLVAIVSPFVAPGSPFLLSTATALTLFLSTITPLLLAIDGDAVIRSPGVVIGSDERNWPSFRFASFTSSLGSNIAKITDLSLTFATLALGGLEVAFARAFRGLAEPFSKSWDFLSSEALMMAISPDANTRYRTNEGI